MANVPMIGPTLSFTGVESTSKAPSTTGPTSSTMSRFLKRKASVASMASSMVSAKNAEGKVVLRGMLSLSSYTCFVVSYSYLLWSALIHGQRPSVQFDWFLVSTKFIPDFCEPLILFLLDRQFKDAFKELMGWE
ncbi:hypothetical protein BCR44DRAFT_41192 [Catenaria anguillulae PL171]|uniref:Uncharacterized protein n=1 Tax=Catenaria anguillulae PL171 TaxID=765915 RepID=A0A1Y2HCZ4_9FUNG|nr:hypothetical protein BCR44DRAFT_41192 [Catenaria anguillulae PL171]